MDLLMDWSEYEVDSGQNSEPHRNEKETPNEPIKPIGKPILVKKLRKSTKKVWNRLTILRLVWNELMILRLRLVSKQDKEIIHKLRYA